MFTLRVICVAVATLGFGLLVSANPPQNKSNPPPNKNNPPSNKPNPPPNKNNPPANNNNKSNVSNNKNNPPTNNGTNTASNNRNNPQNVNSTNQGQLGQGYLGQGQGFLGQQGMLPYLLMQRQMARQQQLMNMQGLLGAYAMSRFQMPFVPGFSPPYAYLGGAMPNMGMGGRYPNMPQNGLGQPGTPAPSMGGFSRELVLELSDTTSFSQLRPGTLTQYQPAKSDALKVGQTISVLAKNDPTATKLGTWSFPAQITAIDDGTPKKLTVMAKLDPSQGEFDPTSKIITAVSIRAQPTAAPK